MRRLLWHTGPDLAQCRGPCLWRSSQLPDLVFGSWSQTAERLRQPTQGELAKRQLLALLPELRGDLRLVEARRCLNNQRRLVGRADLCVLSCAREAHVEATGQRAFMPEGNTTS